MWHYDSDRNVCSQFVYGGCLGNANRFEKIEDCQAQCVVDDKGCKYFFSVSYDESHSYFYSL